MASPNAFYGAATPSTNTIIREEQRARYVRPAVTQESLQLFNSILPHPVDRQAQVCYRNGVATSIKFNTCRQNLTSTDISQSARCPILG